VTVRSLGVDAQPLRALLDEPPARSRSC
jgi:hypothetical protein